MQHGKSGYVELKSRAGRVSKVQREARASLLAGGAQWFFVRSARAGMKAFQLADVEFRYRWTEPQLRAWEGPFTDPSQRHPQAPEVARRHSEADRRWRERARERRRLAREATQRASEASNGAIRCSRQRIEGVRYAADCGACCRQGSDIAGPELPEALAREPLVGRAAEP